LISSLFTRDRSTNRKVVSNSDGRKIADLGAPKSDHSKLIIRGANLLSSSRYPNVTEYR